MIVDCAAYQAGRRRPEALTIEDARTASTQPDTWVWIGLFEPTVEEFDSVRAAFELHELAVEDAIQAHQRPKLEVYDDTLFVVLKTARYVDQTEEVEFGEILIFIGDGFVVVVRHGEASQLVQVRRGLERQRDLLSLGTAAVLYAILDRVVDDYALVLEGLIKDTQEVEKEVFSEARTNPVERIYFLKREVLEFQQAVSPLTEPLNRLARGHFEVIPAELREYFRDVHDHAVRISDQVAGYRDALTSVLEANLTQVGIRQNEDMRRISAWVAVAVVPTLIAGIFGMNFSRMPGVDQVWGFPAVIVIMGAVASGLWVLFRRSGWL